MNNEGTVPEVSDDLKRKLRKVLELAKRAGTEGEAQAAAHRLQEILTKYNLDIADLELRTGKVTANVGKQDSGLHKNLVFKWKLDLAETLSEHYFCAPIINKRDKSILFVGRPDNVESLRMLYHWLIEQIADLSREARRVHLATTGEHVDPLRWQLGFGEGAVVRLGQRLEELRQRQVDAQTTALVVHHRSEVSDYLEEQFGYRVDGQPTKKERERRERWAREAKEKEDLKKKCEESGDMEPYYAVYSWERPKSEEEAAADAKRMRQLNAKWDKQDRAKEKRRQERAGRPGYDAWGDKIKYESEDDRHARKQKERAHHRGVMEADKINLQPFLGSGRSPKKAED